ncbi:MAG: AI-2E family transporter [Frankiales bacterium]|nr:AI-2E family transporter [Frankiales bacterium]
MTDITGAAGVPATVTAPPDPADRLPTSRAVWRSAWVVVAVVAVGLFVNFVVGDGGAVIFTVLMSWFAAVAMEPAVRPLSRHMRRGAATGIVMVSFVVLSVLFVLVFGQLLVSQIKGIVTALPGLVDHLLTTVSGWTGSTLSLNDLLASLNIAPNDLAAYAGNILAAVLTLAGAVLSSVFGLFTFGLFTFYISADYLRLRTYIATLFPLRVQRAVIDVWDVTATKTGNYVAARVVLATINSVTTGIVFVIIGMPYWLALAIWTGVVAQFVPTIGTYISIILPVIVGLLSPTPIVGVIALVWALLYQQVENLTIEPRISARAVDVHPAVAFGSVMLGAALFGAAGALLAIPVIAMVISLSEGFRLRHGVDPKALEPPALAPPMGLVPKRRKRSDRHDTEPADIAPAAEAPADAPAGEAPA